MNDKYIVKIVATGAILMYRNSIDIDLNDIVFEMPGNTDIKEVQKKALMIVKKKTREIKKDDYAMDYEEMNGIYDNNEFYQARVEIYKNDELLGAYYADTDGQNYRKLDKIHDGPIR